MRPIAAIGLSLGTVILCNTTLALTPAQRTELAQSIGTIVVPAGNAPRMGTCIVVSEQGFVVTSLQILQGASGANVVFRDGSKHEVAGFVAAREGKDLVVLALRNPKDLPPPLKLAATNVKAGEPIEFIASAAAQPNDWSQGKLVRYLSGRQFLAGLEKIGTDEQRLDPDTCLLRTDVLQPVAGLGAAMINQQGELAGMITYLSPWGQRMHTAVHVAHIRELLSDLEKPKTTSLAGLKRFNDPPPLNAPEELVSTPATSSLFLARGDVGQQLAAWQARQAAIKQESEALKEVVKKQEAEIEKIKEALADNSARQRDLRREIDSMQPEESYKDEEKVTKINPKTGKKETDTKTVTKKRFSARQKAERSRLEGQITSLQSAAAGQRSKQQRCQSWLEQCQIDEAAGPRQALRLWTDLLHLADAWKLRDGASHQAVAASLNEALTAADSGLLRLTRGLVRQNLQDFAGARDDFQQVSRLDNQLSSVAKACQARTLMKQGQESEGKRLLSPVTRYAGKDPLVAVAQALIELDAGRFAGTERHLLNALDCGGDPAEIHRVLALIHSTAPEGQPHSAAKALDHARRACAMTAWQDSEALLALAAAHAEDGKFDEAAKVADRAAGLASGEVLKRAQTWRETFEKDQRLRLAWGR